MFDWNINNKVDEFDHYINMQVSNFNSNVDSSNLNSTNKYNNLTSNAVDNNKIIIFKSILVIFMCCFAVIIPIYIDMGLISKLIFIVSAICISLVILNNNYLNDKS